MRCPNHPDSIVRGEGGGFRTLMGGGHPFWDENDVYHHHDPNTLTSGYHCSEGCLIVAKRLGPCPAEGCDFGYERIERVDDEDPVHERFFR